ncbi:hypothetical protein Bca4012_065081 [Brassica carinata]
MPSHHYLCSNLPSHNYFISAQATVTPSPHVCYSSPSPHFCCSSPSFQSMERRKVQDAIEEDEEQEEREGIKR